MVPMKTAQIFSFLLTVFGQLEEIGNYNIIIAGDLNIAVGPLDYKGTRDHHSNVHAKDTFNFYIDEFYRFSRSISSFRHSNLLRCIQIHATIDIGFSNFKSEK